MAKIICYKLLWKPMIDRNMNRQNSGEISGISTAAVQS